MVKIISDSTCDLSPELIARYDIDIIPLHIILGEADYLDGQGVTPDDIYRWSDENRTSPKTAALALEDAVATLTPYVDAGREVMCFTISSSMSSTYNVLCMAAEQTNPALVQVIDSKNLSTGVGLQVIAAAEMAQKGSSAEEIVTNIKANRELVRASFVVDTLTYLHRGGRCSSVAALMGGALGSAAALLCMDPVIAVLQSAFKLSPSVWTGQLSMLCGLAGVVLAGILGFAAAVMPAYRSASMDPQSAITQGEV